MVVPAKLMWAGKEESDRYEKKKGDSRREGEREGGWERWRVGESEGRREGGKDIGR